MPAEVSVITAVGPRSGHQRYLEPLYESLTTSSLEDWEWCVQIDCDPDFRSSRDLRVLESQAEKDIRVKVAYNANHSGISVTRNLAMIRASAPFVMGLDADDMIDPDTLRRWSWIMENHPDIAYVFGTPLIQDEDQPGEEPEPQASDLAPGRLESGTIPDRWLEDRKLPLHPEGVMWRRALALRFGGFTALPNGGDEALALALADAFPVFHDVEPSWTHRVHGEATSRWLGGQEVRQIDGTKAMMDLHRIGEL